MERTLVSLSTLARDHGVESSVTIHGRVNHTEALRIQQASDILLLMQWDNPENRVIYRASCGIFRRPPADTGAWPGGRGAGDRGQKALGRRWRRPIRRLIARWLTECLETKRRRED